ncbi:Probable protein phosphatase 2C 76 [Linum perenne]
MMVDSGSTAAKPGPAVVGNLNPEKEDADRCISGGCKSEDGKLSCGYSSLRGKRATMEDFYDIKTTKLDEKLVCMFGIFDGHGGSRASEYLKQHLFENLMKHPHFLTDTKSAINTNGALTNAGVTYQQTDADFLDFEKDTYRDDGSTASTAVLVGDHLYVANVGDSRTVVSKSGKAIALSEDHKPNRIDERKRIESAGGIVMWAGTWRVGGVLAMSRAFGDRMLKQYVVAEPEIQDLKLDDEFELLVLASDGLWDVISNEDAISLARTEEDPEASAKKLVETAFTRGSADNITCIVVRFHHHRPNPSDSSDPPKDTTTESTESTES